MPLNKERKQFCEPRKYPNFLSTIPWTINQLPRTSTRAIVLYKIARVEAFVQDDRRYTLRNITVEIGLSMSMVHKIDHEKLRYWKLFIHWLPQQIDEKQFAPTMAFMRISWKVNGSYEVYFRTLSSEQPARSPRDVAVIVSQWSKKSTTADMTSSYELFCLWTFQPTFVWVPALIRQMH